MLPDDQRRALADAYAGDWLKALRAVPGISAVNAFAVITEQLSDGSATWETFADVADEVRQVHSQLASLLDAASTTMQEEEDAGQRLHSET